MNAIAIELADTLLDRLSSISTGERLLVGIAGIPASGKTSFAKLVCDQVNAKQSGTCVVVSLDGWHHSREELSQFPDPKLAFDRRGAEWTFDAQGYGLFMQKLRIPSTDDTDPSLSRVIATAPSFSHVLKDPVQDDIPILLTHRVVILEGLYVFLGTERWLPASQLLHERWLIEVDVDVAIKRLTKRHVATGVTKDLEEAIWRATNNDMPNGQFVLDHILPPTRRIPSLEDPVMESV
ncbi:hypothetical protein FRC03_000629 [Tulasnella sp. 419]|nr:hypothetical protein FRC03_000629 [Tulasnella sp. 419]